MYIYKRKSIYYIALDNGKRVSTGTGNKTKALHFLKDLKVSPLPEVHSIRLSELEALYVEYAKLSFTKKSVVNVEMALRMLIAYMKEYLPAREIFLSDLTRDIMEEYLLTYGKEHPYGARLLQRTLRSAFNWAIEKKYTAANPFTRIKLPKPVKNQPLFITKDTLDKILEKSQLPRLNLLYEFAYYTGMRLGEIIYLTWGSVDLLKKEIHVRNSNVFTTKSKKERTVPMSLRVYKILIFLGAGNFPESAAYVFQSKPGIHYEADYVSKKFKAAARLALSENTLIKFHTLRHSTASNLVIAGVSLYMVKEILGHSNYSTTQIYAHLQNDALHKAIASLE